MNASLAGALPPRHRGEPSRKKKKKLQFKCPQREGFFIVECIKNNEVAGIV